jgi:hypothetical protein
VAVRGPVIVRIHQPLMLVTADRTSTGRRFCR